ncbi:hypothetical protein, partial [Thiolapillus sp.]
MYKAKRTQLLQQGACAKGQRLMRAERLADRLVIMPEPQEGNKRLMRLYFTYPVMLAIGLLVFSVAGIGPSFLGSESTDLHIITVLAYLVLSI